MATDHYHTDSVPCTPLGRTNAAKGSCTCCHSAKRTQLFTTSGTECKRTATILADIAQVEQPPEQLSLRDTSSYVLVPMCL
eukprot:1374581-Amphidinium_carterae.1